VRQIEESGSRAHRVVLFDEPAILHGHLPPGERDHARAERAVSGIECGLVHEYSDWKNESAIETSVCAHRVQRALDFNVGTTCRTVVGRVSSLRGFQWSISPGNELRR
jgi:hypothetical protein